uniref:Nep-5 like spider venom protein Nep-737 n=1 Tax=Nephila pilipes TaxID=299642 RepID=A0A1X9PYJ5_NEPPI|nr:Nep-5 like spider venom protein Nep-737 [Nephila pilipes]
MKAYFSIMVVVCVVLLSLQAVEMSPNARERRQSDNDNIVPLEVPQNLLIRLLQGLLGALGLGGILGR